MESCCALGGRDFGLSEAKSSGAPKALNRGALRSCEIEFIKVAGGSFQMGSVDADANPLDNEGPIREVWVDEFEIASTPVTNGQFAEFVAATGYVTEAEEIGWSFVFHLLVSDRSEVIGESQEASWWFGVEGANWRRPNGGDSNYSQLADHPVVHVSYKDAIAFCEWANASLPTEEQWEKAARGGLVSNRFPWGNDLLIEGKWQCNIFQGNFPHNDSAAGINVGTSPVKKFSPNGFGGYDFSGNVWEWTSTKFYCAEDTKRHRAEIYLVSRGGSYLCHESYCNRYRVGARNKIDANSVAGNVGFRVVGGYR